MKDKSNKNSDNITFRISSKLIEILHSKAAEDGISLNTLVNQVIEKYLEWNAQQLTRTFGVMEKSILKEFIDLVDSKHLEEITIKLTDPEDIMPLTKGKDDVESLLQAIAVLAKRSGYATRVFQEGERRRIIIQHEMGAKWSKMYKLQVEQLLKNANHAIMLEATDNSLIIRAEFGKAG